MGLAHLIQKYSTPGPRYTSYPTAPHWTESVGVATYQEALSQISCKPEQPLGLYVHLPFCEKLCYYCGCNIQVTRDKDRSRSYLHALKREAAVVSRSLGERRTLNQMSWGGGTPTFLGLAEIEDLFIAIAEYFRLDPNGECSIEIDPRVTTLEQLRLLRRLGFNRVSLGVQDFDARVQEAVNRVQPTAMTGSMLTECRAMGFQGINFDLIYGLPLQTVATFEKTVESVLSMRPDRIALYNYARLPSLLKHQAILEKYEMPCALERVAISTMALQRLSNAGYVSIGMDHFALPEDGLAHSMREGRLYRNFMGYTVKQSVHLLGLGASAIGEVANGFFQNTRKPSDYEQAIDKVGLATLRGLLLSEEDQRRRWTIQSLLCQFELDFALFESRFGIAAHRVFASELEALRPLESDGILELQETGIRITEVGRLFVRNIAMAFDAYLDGAQGTFSKTV